MCANPFTCRPDYRSLELAVIQEWQPRLNYPLICQFFHTKKGLLKRPAMNANAQFGLATLWCLARHRFTAQVVQDILASDRFQTASSCGTSSMILDPLQKLVSRLPSFFNPTKVASLSATPCVVSAPTSKNPIGLSLCKRVVEGKPAPKASALRATWQTPYVGSFDNGTFVCWNARFHAMCCLSRPSSSSMHQLLTSSATTN